MMIDMLTAATNYYNWTVQKV